MNRKGQLVIVGMMISVVIFIMIVALVEPLKEQSTTARTNLDCDNTSLSAGEASTCIVTDSYLFLYAGFGLAVALGWFGLRKVGGIE